jgi:DamX protein
MVPPMPPNSPEPPDAAGFLHHDASAEPSNPSTASGINGQRLETLQSSLVERIAAVDDERRRTATQMQRAIETNRGEMLQQCRRQRVLLALAASLIILLTAVAVGYLQYRLGATSRALADAVARLEERVTAFVATPPASASRGSKSESSASPSALEASAEGIEDQLSVLRQRVASLSNDLAAVQAGSEAPANAVTETAATPETIAAAPSSTTSADGAVDATADQQDLVAFGAVAMLDSMIDRRWREVQEEYQRLALEVASPAVRSRDVDDGGEGSDADPEIDSDTGSAGEETAQGSEPARPLPEARPAPSRLQLEERPFVLQLIGVYDRVRLDDFIADHSLPEQVYIREERFRGRPWFVLFHSLHPDQSSARKAMQSLPPELAALEPWIRKLPEGVELEVMQRQDAQP